LAFGCTEWTVRDVLNHVVSEQFWVPHLLAGETLAEVGHRYDGDVLGTDPLAAWTSASTAARRAWLEPGATGRQVHLSFGQAEAAEYGWQLTGDLAVHGWDIAVGIGAPQQIRDDLAEQLITRFAPQLDMWQLIGLFNPPVPIPDTAHAADRLVALMGRRARH